MSKFVGKHRNQKFYLEEDEYDSQKSYVKAKKRKSEDAELKRMRMQDYREDNYGYDDNYRKSKKYAKL